MRLRSSGNAVFCAAEPASGSIVRRHVVAGIARRCGLARVGDPLLEKLQASLELFDQLLLPVDHRAHVRERAILMREANFEFHQASFDVVSFSHLSSLLQGSRGDVATCGRTSRAVAPLEHRQRNLTGSLK